MTYLSDMEKGRKQFYKEIREAFEAYFNAPNNPLGQSDVDTLMVIIQDHVEYHFPEAGFASNTNISDPGITLVEGEGLNIAYDYGSALESDLFKALTMTKRVELLEACIYALNSRINNIEQQGENEDGG